MNRSARLRTSVPGPPGEARRRARRTSAEEAPQRGAPLITEWVREGDEGGG